MRHESAEAGLGLMPRKRRERVDAHLNLIPLIDILSVLVAFLLVYSTDVEVMQNSKGVIIPQSRTDVRPKQSVVVMVTKDAVFVQGEKVATLAEVSDPPRSWSSHCARCCSARSPGSTRRRVMRRSPRARSRSWPTRTCRTKCCARFWRRARRPAYGKISLAVLQKETAGQRGQELVGLPQGDPMTVMSAQGNSMDSETAQDQQTLEDQRTPEDQQRAAER